MKKRGWNYMCLENIKAKYISLDYSDEMMMGWNEGGGDFINVRGLTLCIYKLIWD